MNIDPIGLTENAFDCVRVTRDLICCATPNAIVAVNVNGEEQWVWDLASSSDDWVINGIARYGASCICVALTGRDGGVNVLAYAILERNGSPSCFERIRLPDNIADLEADIVVSDVFVSGERACMFVGALGDAVVLDLRSGTCKWLAFGSAIGVPSAMQGDRLAGVWSDITQSCEEIVLARVSGGSEGVVERIGLGVVEVENLWLTESGDVISHERVASQCKLVAFRGVGVERDRVELATFTADVVMFESKVGFCALFTTGEIYAIGLGDVIGRLNNVNERELHLIECCEAPSDWPLFFSRQKRKIWPLPSIGSGVEGAG